MTKMLTPTDIEEITGLSKPTVFGFIHDPDPDRRLPSLRLGTRILIRPEDFEGWLERQQTDGKVAYRGPRKRRRKAASRR